MNWVWLGTSILGQLTAPKEAITYVGFQDVVHLLQPAEHDSHGVPGWRSTPIDCGLDQLFKKPQEALTIDIHAFKVENDEFGLLYQQLVSIKASLVSLHLELLECWDSPSSLRMRSAQDTVRTSGGLYTLLRMLVAGVRGCSKRGHQSHFKRMLVKLLSRCLMENAKPQEAFTTLQPRTPPEGFSSDLKSWPAGVGVTSKVTSAWESVKKAVLTAARAGAY